MYLDHNYEYRSFLSENSYTLLLENFEIIEEASESEGMKLSVKEEEAKKALDEINDFYDDLTKEMTEIKKTGKMVKANVMVQYTKAASNFLTLLTVGSFFVSLVRWSPGSSLSNTTGIKISNATMSLWRVAACIRILFGTMLWAVETSKGLDPKEKNKMISQAVSYESKIRKSLTRVKDEKSQKALEDALDSIKKLKNTKFAEEHNYISRGL